jgi:hypothetical protein
MKSKGLSIIFLFALAFGCDQVDPPISYNAQLEIDIAKIDEFLLAGNIDAVKDASGLRYKVLEEGIVLRLTIRDFCLRITQSLIKEQM